MNIWVALLESGLGIFEQSIKSHQKYYADGKWSVDDTAKFLMEVSLAGLYGISHTLSAHLDDVIFAWIEKATGGDDNSDMTVIEKAAAGYAILAENIGNAVAKFGKNLVSGLVNMWNQFIGWGNSVGESIGGALVDIFSANLKADDNATYVTASGEVTTSIKKAVANIAISDGKFIYTTLKTNAQNISAGSSADTMDWIINTQKGKDKIFLNSSKNSTINSGAGNDSVIGGSGKDFFIYAAGDGADVIEDYVAGKDKIKITSGEISNSTLKNSDVVLKIGSGSLTVNEGKGKKITITDANGNTTTKIYSGAGSAPSVARFFFLQHCRFLFEILPRRHEFARRLVRIFCASHRRYHEKSCDASFCQRR